MDIIGEPFFCLPHSSIRTVLSFGLGKFPWVISLLLSLRISLFSLSGTFPNVLSYSILCLLHTCTIISFGDITKVSSSYTADVSSYLFLGCFVLLCFALLCFAVDLFVLVFGFHIRYLLYI